MNHDSKHNSIDDDSEHNSIDDDMHDGSINDESDGGTLDDDSDSADYEYAFGGPDDDAIERRNAFQYEVTDEEREYWLPTVNNEMEPNKFFDFPDAVAYAKNQASSEKKCFVISITDWGWRVDKELNAPRELGNYSSPVPTESRNATAFKLIQALREKDLPLAVSLLQQPLEVNTTDSRGVTPLMVAAHRGMSDICKKLLSMGAIADLSFYGFMTDDADELSTLERAHASGNGRTIDLIERAYVQERWDWLKTKDKSNPKELPNHLGEQLVEAANCGMTSLVIEMIEAGAEINYGSHGEFCSPLCAAFKSGHPETSLVLVVMGANLDWMREQDRASAEAVALETAVTDFRKAFSSIKSNPFSRDDY